MRNLGTYIFISFVLAIFQNVFFYELFGPGFSPNLIAAYLMALLALNRKTAATSVAFISGLCLDLFSQNTLGISSTILIIFVLVGDYVQSYLVKSVYTNLILLLLFTLLYTPLATLNFELGANVTIWQLLVGAIFTAMFGVLFYVVTKRYLKPSAAGEYSY